MSNFPEKLEGPCGAGAWVASSCRKLKDGRFVGMAAVYVKRGNGAIRGPLVSFVAHTRSAAVRGAESMVTPRMGVADKH